MSRVFESFFNCSLFKIKCSPDKPLDYHKGHLSKVCNSTQTSTDSPKPQSTANPQGQPNIKIVQSPAQPLSQELNQQTGSTEPQEYTLFNLPNNNYPPLEVSVSINNVDLKMEVDQDQPFQLLVKTLIITTSILLHYNLLTFIQWRNYYYSRFVGRHHTV